MRDAAFGATIYHQSYKPSRKGVLWRPDQVGYRSRKLPKASPPLKVKTWTSCISGNQSSQNVGPTKSHENSQGSNNLATIAFSAGDYVRKNQTHP